MLRAQRRDPAKAQAKCAFATNYPLANRQLRSPLILRYRMQRDKPFICLILQITLIGWVPAAIWAAYALSQYNTDQKIAEISGN